MALPVVKYRRPARPVLTFRELEAAIKRRES